MCWGVASNLEGCGDSTLHRGCVFGPFKIKVKLCIKLMFLHACVINFVHFYCLEC